MIFLDLLKNLAQTTSIAAIDVKNNPLTYAELESRSDAIAAHWASLPKKSVIVLRGDKENDIITCMFACLKSGHPYTFVPSYFPDEKLLAIIAKSEASLVVCFDSMPACSLSVQAIGQAELDELASSGKKPDSNDQCGHDDLACIFFTSGSTGDPKGVMLTLGNLEYMEYWWSGVTDRKVAAPKVLNFSSYAFSASLVTVYCYMLRFGGCLYAIDKKLSQNASALIETILQVKPHYLDCTPSFIDLCMQSNHAFGNELLPDMALISVGGEPLTANIAELMLQRFPNTVIINGYGATEAAAGHISCEVTKDMLKTEGPLPIGYTVDGSYVLVVDEARKPVPDGTPGELVMVSPMISTGYLRDSEKTEKVFFVDENGMRGYYTGDMVIKNSDGCITYIGRMNNLVKIGGYRVELEEIEFKLNAIDGVYNSVVVPVYNNERATMLAAFIIPVEPPKNTLSEFQRIKRLLKESLPPYMVPQKIIFTEDFPKNNNGKLDRRVLIEKVRIN